MACYRLSPSILTFETGKLVGHSEEGCAPLGREYSPDVPGIHGVAPKAAVLGTIHRDICATETCILFACTSMTTEDERAGGEDIPG